MKKPTSTAPDKASGLEIPTVSPVGRRLFMRYAGATAISATALVEACTMQDHNLPVGTVNLGSGDTGILNYAYALEQLEAAFYERVALNPYSGITAAELRLLVDIRDHEIVHREFFKAALGTNAIPALTFNFGAVNFSSRESVLQTARTFEDLGVSAYNGAGRLLQNAQFLLLAGKIVSVEARHAAAIRDVLMPKTAFFAGDDVVEPMTGLDVVRTPLQVLPLAQPFISTPISGANLPTM
ncbi:hypothetical protein GCM10023187_48720 [Nibrella viscosa]|uniref:Ferritin-like domain-containing protein n=1 Tax=Nibrella viscosa TaxID=1084524 RepID=A0ABP8KUZ4_9BACT